MENRIVELEKKVSFQEYTIDQLSELINDQAKIIESLQKEIKFVKEKMSEENLIDPKRTPVDDKPPHY